MAIRNLMNLLVLMLLMTGGSVYAAGGSTYKLSAGDVVRISVFGEPNLSFEEIRLNDAGVFSYPFIGEVRAKGKTALEVEQLLTRSLEGDYLVSPRVSVSVLQYREFFVSGEVKQPGGYKYLPGLTVRRAVALSGGLTERASERRITIVRDGDSSRTPKPADMNTVVMPGDTITIDQGFF